MVISFIQRRPAIVFAAMLLLATIGGLDYLTGDEFEFFIFYFLPVSLVAWQLGRGPAIIAAVLCAGSGFVADLSSQQYSSEFFRYWDAFVRLAAYVLMGLVLSRLKSDFAREKDLNTKLSQALTQVRQLRGLLPICASCKRIRNDKGYWNEIEEYIRDHSEANFSHGICPECFRKLYPELQEKAEADEAAARNDTKPPSAEEAVKNAR